MAHPRPSSHAAPSPSGTRVQGETEHRRRSKEKQNTVSNYIARRNRNRTSDSEGTNAQIRGMIITDLCANLKTSHGQHSRFLE
ncbi:hypothetical protein ACS0TY_006371 [Phlomoides rotata]